jgi:hypothetical protein
MLRLSASIAAVARPVATMAPESSVTEGAATTAGERGPWPPGKLIAMLFARETRDRSARALRTGAAA